MSTHTEICVVGSDKRADKVAQRLETLDVAIRRYGADLSLTDAIGATTAALVLVQPLENRDMTQAIAALRDAPSGMELPIFVAAFDKVPDKEVRRFYEAGATAVFHWSQEAIIFPRLVAEVVGIDEARGKARTPDVALARAVRARLRLADGLAAPLRLNATGGVVRVEGEVDQLWQRYAVEDLVAHVPGVTGVMTNNIRVGASGLSDHDIEQSVASLLRATTTSDTLAMSVVNGGVRLAGSIDAKMELRRIVDLIGHVRGVRGVDNLVTVSSSQRRSDQRVANHINKGLASVFAGQKITVSVFGQVAVVSGKVKSLDTKRKILTYVDASDGIERVVNKLVVN